MATTQTAPGRTLMALQRYQGLVGLFLLLLVAFFLVGKTFYSPQNVSSILERIAVPGTLAVGMTFVILTGGIDLSVGSHLALLNCVVATWGVTASPLWVTALYVLGLGAAIGLVTGGIVNTSRLQPFVVTLAAMVSLRGISFVYTKNSNVSGVAGGWLDPLRGSHFGLPTSAWILLIVTVVAAGLLTYTVFGRNVYATGGNEEAARLSGVSVDRVRLGAYAVNGLCVAIAALLFTARTNNGQPGAGIGYELDAIAAVVVGGSSLLGGFGSVLGSFIGAMFIACIDVLLILRGVDDKVGLGLKGIIILAAVYLQNAGRR